MSREVADGVVEKRLAHSKVLYLTAANLLVDTGPESEWDELRSFLDEVGDVNRVLVTHGHGDHFGNAERVVETYDPEVLCPEDEPLEDTPLRDENVTRIADGDELADGVRVVQVPGHTPGIVALYLEEDQTLLATDVLDGSDRRGLPAGYLLPPPAMYNWDAKQAEVNLERLLELDFHRAIVTHGTNVDEDARDKLERYLDFPNHYRKRLLEDAA